MQQKFDIVKITASLAERTLQVIMSREVDEQSVSRDVVMLTEKASHRVVPCAIETAGSVITLRLQEWPVPNAEYLLVVQAGILSVIGEKLPASLQRSIVFSGEITNQIRILAPAMFEKLDGAALTWEEIGENAVLRYFVEIAADAAFYDVLVSSVVENSPAASFGGLAEDRQYFARVRVQSASSYGPWSQTVTFFIATKSGEGTQDPVFLKPLLLVGAPEDGITPAVFTLTFSASIAGSEPVVSLVRRLAGGLPQTVLASASIAGPSLLIDADIVDNAVYDIIVSGVTAAGWQSQDPYKLSVTTALTPLYADIDSVAGLLSGWTASRATLLQLIHTASQYADYLLANSTSYTTNASSGPSFATRQFVKYRAAKEALLSLYIAKAESTSRAGKIGEVSFEAGQMPNLKNLIDNIDAEVKNWMDAMLGYKMRGYVKPKSVIKSSKSASTTRQDGIAGGGERTDL